MNKVVAALALGLACSACLAPVDDSGETALVEPGHVTEAMAALTAAEREPKAIDPTTDGRDPLQTRRLG